MGKETVLHEGVGCLDRIPPCKLSYWNHLQRDFVLDSLHYTERTAPPRSIVTQPLKQLTRQTLIYGAGNVLSRLVTFLLLPLFTNVLSPEEYGLTTLVYVFLGFMNIVYHYGLDAAFMRYYSNADGGGE